MKTLAEQLTIAINIANTGHAGQKDRGGQPYILHCLWVMQRQLTVNRKICAVVHDVVEDTTVTLNDLRNAGLSERQVITVDLLTRRKHESSRRYINRILAASGTVEGQDAIAIKIDDTIHNCDLRRLLEVTDKDREQVVRRMEILAKLKAVQSFDGFLDGQNLEQRRFP
jgi:(p)ppGpp synthase/HD superfamily hydrolase